MQPPSIPTSGRKTRGLKSLSESGPFASLARRARELDILDRQLRQTLPPPLRDQVRFADLRDGRLVFLAPSPAWASRLRLMQTQILATARANGTPASSLTVKVAPLPPEEMIPERRKPLSATAASHLTAAAASLSDPNLKALFLELASQAKKTDESET
ncbi:MAG TPA: DUF721 domain-containing protein [Luteibacter sp.]|jgi:hypothetical protein|nr:DUF721 domain-containing protein [Luteibacter sp.]